jgi:hypothetical protein
VKKLEGRPFVLLGVNADRDRDQVRRVVTVKGLNWRSWWDGDGRIARRWQVESWPTIYVLDGQGVIRYRVKDVAELERAVAALLGKMEGGRQ